MIILLLGLLTVVSAGSPSEDKETYKNQYCTDPRTMKKHPAYTEWADTYSCTRHRCQPGGRNLAIYTVGCKRIEAPESAIECEEVVEDTNMQFPFCCTRLRCLVLVRGEVWTKVLGQPWETLPAAPWSHMYKMKKPPPSGSTAVPKTPELGQGPIFELAENEPEAANHDKVLRSGKKPVTDNTNWNEKDPAHVPSPAMPPPDIATDTSAGTNEVKSEYNSHKRGKRRNTNSRTPTTYVEVTESAKHTDPVFQDLEASTEKPQDPIGRIEEETEKYFPNNLEAQKLKHNLHNTHNSVYRSADIPQNQWNEPTEGLDLSEHLEIPGPSVDELEGISKKDQLEKPANLQVLVDAIGTRMKDIENVVQKMSDKVVQKPTDPDCSNEKRSAEADGPHGATKNAVKRPSNEDENYKRFSGLNKLGSKYLHTSDASTENPLFIEDTNVTGYFSDASNNVLRRKTPLQDHKPTYMAPVENHHKAHVVMADSENAEPAEKKHKKHLHKKRKSKGSHSHKKHSRSKDDKRKHFKKLGSVEAEKNAISIDDSSAGTQ